MEHEVKVLKSGKRLPAKKMSLLSRPAAGSDGDMSQRMMWAEEVEPPTSCNARVVRCEVLTLALQAMKGVHFNQPKQAAPPQMHVAKSSGTQQLAVPFEGNSVWYNVVSNGDNAQVPFPVAYARSATSCAHLLAAPPRL